MVKGIWRKRKVTISLAILLVLGVICTLGVKAYLDTPRNIGPALTYIGKQDQGCPIYLFFICDSRPATKFYFETDMSEADLKTYFKNLAYSNRNTPATTGTDDFYKLHPLAYDFKDSQAYAFTIEYYYDPSIIAKTSSLKLHKRYLVGVDSAAYQIAKDSVKE